MYNLWWVVIGLGIIAFVLIILCYIYNIKSDNYFLDWGPYGGPTLIIGVICLVMFVSAIINPIAAKNKYYEFLETKVLVEQLGTVNYDQYENLGLNSKIIELNQWLVQAKASKKQYGNWSMYYALDVENLDYIVLGGVQK